jgi:hypothetical protein
MALPSTVVLSSLTTGSSLPLSTADRALLTAAAMSEELSILASICSVQQTLCISSSASVQLSSDGVRLLCKALTIARSARLRSQ